MKLNSKQIPRNCYTIFWNAPIPTPHTHKHHIWKAQARSSIFGVVVFGINCPSLGNFLKGSTPNQRMTMLTRISSVSAPGYQPDRSIIIVMDFSHVCEPSPWSCLLHLSILDAEGHFINVLSSVMDMFSNQRICKMRYSPVSEEMCPWSIYPEGTQQQFATLMPWHTMLPRPGPV